MEAARLAVMKEKLESARLIEVEMLAQNVALRNSRKFKECVALLVILTFSGASESFSGFYNRLVAVFNSITNNSEDANGRRTFGRPIFRRSQASANDGAHCPCVCSWAQEKSVAVDIPNGYEGFKSALMYLFATDSSRYFACYSAEAAAIETPCFLEMFHQSSPNNKHNLDGLCGEYLALIAFCFGKGCIGPEWTYGCVTSKFDFFVKRGRQEIGVSVKSVNFHPIDHFCEPTQHDAWRSEGDETSGSRRKRKHKDDGTGRLVRCGEGENVLLHSCQCESCVTEPIRSITVTVGNLTTDGNGGRRVTLPGLSCACKEKFETVVHDWLPRDVLREDDDPESDSDWLPRDVLREDDDPERDSDWLPHDVLREDDDPESDSESDSDDEDEGSTEVAVIHLVSARLFYELRYAICCFDQATFRGVGFRLREFLIEKLSTADRAVDATRPALINRANGLV